MSTELTGVLTAETAQEGIAHEREALDRLALFIGNRESVQRRTGFTAMADDYAAQLAALQTLRRDHAQLLKVWREQCDGDES